MDRDAIDRLLFGEVLKKFWRGDTDEERAVKRQRIVEEIADYARRVEQGDADAAKKKGEAEWCLQLLDEVLREEGRTLR